ncbi:hypothetical protein AB0M54_39080 [Actinoplanes sp. NPDC051470]|uniref:hypothetical protein n=1 Tax=Actinoplanes sp. NPDC051470 TaxID=3157224 RepID=UPI00341C95FD
MRVVTFIAIAVVVMAAVATLVGSQAPLSKPSAVASAALVAAVAVQRINGVQRWLGAPKSRRREQVDVLAQQVLIDLCMNRLVTAELLELRVHVWEVPLWYRRIFPYALRLRFKEMAKKRQFRFLATWAITPTFKRVAAVGLYKAPPSGVRFQKGVGIVGVCLANNDRAEVLTVSTADRRYRHALQAADEAKWQTYDPKLTHRLPLRDAQKLAHSYGQVIARVVQDAESGEAIGCATISLKQATPATIGLTTGEEFKRKLIDLARGVATLLR